MKKPEIFEPPNDFDKASAALFYAIVNEKEKSESLTFSAIPLVIAYCRAVAGYNEISVQINSGEQDPTLTDYGQIERLNPLYRLQRAYAEQMIKFASVLGITPKYQERVSVKDQANKKPEREGPSIYEIAGLK